MTALFLTFGIALGFSWLALRNSFLLLNFCASVGWVALWITLQSNPPVGVAQGSSAHTAMSLACIAAAI